MSEWIIALLVLAFVILAVRFYLVKRNERDGVPREGFKPRVQRAFARLRKIVGREEP